MKITQRKIAVATNPKMKCREEGLKLMAPLPGGAGGLVSDPPVIIIHTNL